MKPMIVIATLACLALAACDKNDAKPSQDTPATTATATTATTAATTATAQPATATFTDDDLATSADFEDEAAKAISAKTYKTDLADLDKEIAKD